MNYTSNIILSSTLCRAFFRNGTMREYCPKYIKEVIIDKKYDLSGDAIQKGLYFENIAIGKGAYGREVMDLPRKKNGEKRIDQIRIEKQAKTFKSLCKDYGIILTEETVQVKISKQLAPNILLSGNLDICPATVRHPEKGHIMCIIDLKLTKNLQNTFSEFAWMPFENHDDTQGQIYLYLVEDLDLDLNPHLPKEVFEVVQKRGKEMSFFYWVFDFYEGVVKGTFKPLTNQIFEIEKSDIKRRELMETLRKTYLLIEYHNKNGWNPVEGGCEKCPVRTCDFSSFRL